MPMYVKDNDEEEPEDLVELKSGECFEGGPSRTKRAKQS
jgi:hypothetical protein